MLLFKIRCKLRKLIRKLILQRIGRQLCSIRRWSGYLVGDVDWIDENHFKRISDACHKIRKETEDIYINISGW